MNKFCGHLWSFTNNKLRHAGVNLVTVVQVAVALPAAGAGAAEAGGRLRDGGLGAQGRVLVLTAEEFRL